MTPSTQRESEDPVKIPDLLPVLPLRDSVVFPWVIVPLSVTRPADLLAVEHALEQDRLILLVAQRDPALAEPGPDDLAALGTAATIMRMLKLPDGRVRILVQGLARAGVERLIQAKPYLKARVTTAPPPPDEVPQLEVEALVRSVREQLGQAANMGGNLSAEIVMVAGEIDEPGRLADLVASNLGLPPAEAQDILELAPALDRLHRVHTLLQREVQLLVIQQQISREARDEIDRNQREYLLRQQLRTIRDELGESDDLTDEIDEYRRLATDKGLPELALVEVERQVRRLERSQPDSAETAILRTHLEWLTGLPWHRDTEDRLDLKRARQVLDEDHYDLEGVKKRILEALAVRRLNPQARGPILCFVGPPGVGKTSLGRSIARALGREFVRVALGGVRDEAEIRGHRRTYVGALPGRILQGLHQAGAGNPVFMLDEIDKLGTDYRGDPSGALLEVLDPEQNCAFRDHYLGVDYDLSRVLFVATANVLDPIHPAFLDRMEVIRLDGYSSEEKVAIARRHLIPKQLSHHGLNSSHVRFSDAGLTRIIADYTREAGLRGFEREIAATCRRAAFDVASGTPRRIHVGPRTVERLLGPARHFNDELLSRDRVGVATGLAWTAAGGDLIFVEVVAVPGSGKLILTGQLGDVMKESAQAALSYSRSVFGDRQADFFSRHDIHVHVPAGAIPKDGPSAGITIATAIGSVLSGRPVRRRVAMTGEVTLRGDVLPVGGLRVKLLAAREAGVATVALPKLNRRDVEAIPKAILGDLDIRLVDHLDDVLRLALRSDGKPTRRRRRSVEKSG